MITSDLIEYIKGELNDNISKDSIISSLLEAGWIKEDIDEGFLSIEKIETKKNIDKYRELPPEGDPLELRKKAELEIEEKTLPKIDNPIVKIPIFNMSPIQVPLTPPEEVKKQEEKPVEVKIAEEIKPTQIIETVVEKPIVDFPAIKIPEILPEEVKKEEIKPIDVSAVAVELVKKPEFNFPVINIHKTVQEESKEIPQNEPAKIWVPTTIKPIIPEIKQEETKEIVKEVPKIEVFNLELSPKIDKEQAPSSVVSKPEVAIPVVDIQPKKVVEELVPTINKEESIASMGGVINKPDIVAPVRPLQSLGNMSGVVQNRAMLSSYSQDIVSSVKKEDEVVVVGPSPKKKWALKLGIFLIILTLIGGMVFAFVEGYIKIPGSKFNLFVVKKDPKATLLSGALSISKLKSFKTQTNINISSPSLSSITTGLSSGDAVNSNSKDKDSISINAKGLINNVNDKAVIDYVFNIKSSVLEEGLTTNLKYNNGDIFFSVPDLTPILGEDAPKPSTVSGARSQLDLVIKEFPIETQNLIKRLDIYNIISMEVPLYVKNETAGMIKEFINTFEYIDKGEESINGIDTNHYEVTVDRASTKKLLSSFANLFVPQLSPDEKKNLDEAMGATSINSFEIWIGKNDDNIYQFKFTLNTPLSKILGLNDSGIAGNEMKLDWMTTFYDLDVENKIVLPNGDVNIDGFIKNIQNIKTKNLLASFKRDSLLFKNAVGSFGKTNTSGSCTLPVTGSIFSPLGHPKGADTAVSSISTTMNSMLAITKNEGYCYSTPSAWAVEVPFAMNDKPFYCIDSTGSRTTLETPITGTVCSESVIAPTITTTVESKAPAASVIPTKNN